LIARGGGLDEPDPLPLRYGRLRRIRIEQVAEDPSRTIRGRRARRLHRYALLEGSAGIVKAPSIATSAGPASGSERPRIIEALSN
jgi:hypothetical protein